VAPSDMMDGRILAIKQVLPVPVSANSMSYFAVLRIGIVLMPSRIQLTILMPIRIGTQILPQGLQMLENQGKSFDFYSQQCQFTFLSYSVKYTKNLIQNFVRVFFSSHGSTFRKLDLNLRNHCEFTRLPSSFVNLRLASF
jgi:hypothetical protein